MSRWRPQTFRTGPERQLSASAEKPPATPECAETPATSIEEDEPPSGVLLRHEALASVPRLVISLKELKALPLDHRAGFIVSFIDGAYTVGMILDACAMPRKEAMTILRELAARRVIVFDERG
jgi:hypothetical protein